PEKGFITFDATPESFRAGQPSALLSWLTRQYDALDQAWRTQVVDYSFLDQARLTQRALQSLRWDWRGSRGALRAWPLFAILLGAALLTVWLRRLLAPSDEVARLGERMARSLMRASLPLEA